MSPAVAGSSVGDESCHVVQSGASCVVSLTFDTGALIALERNDRKLWTALRSAVAKEQVATVPTVVVAQAWRGSAPQALLARALKLCWAQPLSDELARSAGELCGRSGTADIVDAVVVASAARRSDVIVTSDRTDLERLADLMDGEVAIVDVLGRVRK
jgi:predicted nucleic acid-binding protein